MALIFCRKNSRMRKIPVMRLKRKADAHSCFLETVRQPAFCRAAVARVVNHFGKLDILVNNAAFQATPDAA